MKQLTYLGVKTAPQDTRN